jgi:hypothetical protein
MSPFGFFVEPAFELPFPGRLPPRWPLSGGDEQVRTVDPLLAKQVLSQLSYTPVYFRLFSSIDPRVLPLPCTL